MKSSKDKMIHIGPDWALSGDEQCVTLYKRRVTQKGRVQWDAKGYYKNLEHAYLHLIDMELTPLSDLEDVIKGIDHLKKWLSNAINGCTCGKKCK